MVIIESIVFQAEELQKYPEDLVIIGMLVPHACHLYLKNLSLLQPCLIDDNISIGAMSKL